MNSSAPTGERSDYYGAGAFRQMFDLSDRVAVVVGGGGGLGRALACGLADFSARIVIADLDQQAAAETAAMCSRPGMEALSRPIDVTSHSGVQETFAEIASACGKVDILVNSVGINIRRPAAEYTPEEWYRIININLSGVFFAIQAVAPGMLDRNYGRILTIGSVSSLLGHPFHAPYAATKGGIAIMTKAMATEWAPHGITVNALGPAYTETALTKSLLAEPGKRQELTRGIPMGRLGKPEDLVGAAVYLCSEASSFVTGQTLYIDGGRTAD